ncbi:F420-0:Gamma-glutamyl ligase [Peptoniphilus asaccharolyticus DSM 20463]|uniref:F420-0:Gamma-glutamyl ligase n=1 Tax=Peptoniphilus asaccharolyticus DSM 20463 TaxID=573058 RepID=A0A1W1UJP1_PEPAS|nr:coenzyme F420-0:L-glutamate ligase [Peptoniphilus asaccharolyticus]MBL7574792.1 coenzyme F420-0:L-glutamate ligase [Peptoniphilus asaccharolyticus]SMB81011.1 F420-0:Gamma-glutamyl ligase [Peptoniphilus asaccharolyticus DSM 20463]
MERYFGTVVRGIRTPIVKEGDNLSDIVFDSVVKAVESQNIKLEDKDVVAITESLLARAQGNYVTTDKIAQDVREKFDGEIGLVFPILSRNRFSTLLRGIAQSGRKLHILLSYPSDEVGNHLMDEKALYDKHINPYSDVLEESDYRRLFGEEVKHEFTGIDYVTLYKEIAPNSEIHFSNDPKAILKYTKDVLVCSIHTRALIKQELKDSGANLVYGLDDIMNESIDGSGYNSEYGLLGSNLSDEETVKLFPRDAQPFVEALQEKFNQYSGHNIEVMVYGDGAFKDPVGKIWELADPVVSPGYTKGLIGTPNELKIKYIADTELKGLSGEEASAVMREKINNKDADLVGKNETLGTTPRRLTDLLGSLCDLTSGSGDKGTPVILIQGYFDNYATK